MPAKSHIEQWPNLPKCGFVPVPLDIESLPDDSTIAHKNLDVSVNDTFDDNCSVVCMWHNILEYDENTISFVK